MFVRGFLLLCAVMPHAFLIFLRAERCLRGRPTIECEKNICIGQSMYRNSIFEGRVRSGCRAFFAHKSYASSSIIVLLFKGGLHAPLIKCVHHRVGRKVKVYVNNGRRSAVTIIARLRVVRAPLYSAENCSAFCRCVSLLFIRTTALVRFKSPFPIM